MAGFDWSQLGGFLTSDAFTSFLGGQLGSTGMPGQTQPGAYTPPAGGFGTYNYIPTGATQIDPALIAQILGSNTTNQAAIGAVQPANYANLGGALNNPGAANLIGGATNAGNLAYAQSGNVNQSANYLRDLAPYLFQGANNTAGTMSNLLQQSQNNPFAQQTIQGAGNIGQGMVGSGGNLASTATNFLGGVQGQVGALLSNPYMQLAQQGGNTAGQMLQGTGGQTYNAGQQFSSTAQQGLPAVSQVLQTAFDPQNALYQRSAQQTMDQLGTYLAQSGLTNSGAGAKIAGDTLNNFNIDWQNNQLGRQTAGLQSYTSGLTGAGANLGTGANLQTGAANTYAQGAQLPFSTYQQLGQAQLGNYGALGSALGTAANVLPTAGNLQLQGNSAGSDAFNNNLMQQLQYANAYGNATNNVTNTVNTMGNILSTSAGLGNNAVNLQQLSGMLPYNANQTISNDRNTAISNFLGNTTSGSNLSNQNISQMLQYLNAVMTGSNNAANAASGAQANTANRNASAGAGIGGLLQAGLPLLMSLL